MAYQPRSAQDILRSIAARVVARSDVNDLAEGSVLLHLCGSVAEEMAGIENQLGRVLDSFFLDDVTGRDLDDRVAELPGGMSARQAAVAASGAVMRLTRTSTSGALTIPAGATFGRSDDPTMLYRTIEAYTFADTVATIAGVYVVCLTSGPAGNCAAGTINRIVSAPAGLRSASSTAPLTSGAAAETDDQLRQRAHAYLSSLARSQPQALEYAALSFLSSQNTRFRFVRLFEDLTRPGYSELVVDDGQGLEGLTRPGAPATGAVPSGGIGLFWHEAPATAPIAEVAISRSGEAVVLRAASGDFVSVPERGLIHVVRRDLLQAGDVWSISNYRVFTGPVAELQARIEGTNSDPDGDPGWRAAGTRVRVVPPLRQEVGFDFHIVPLDGVDLVKLGGDVLNTVMDYVGTLGPGEPLFVAKIIDRVMDNAGVRNCKVYRGRSDPPAPAVDIYAQTARHTIRTRAPLLRVIPAPEV